MYVWNENFIYLIIQILITIYSTLVTILTYDHPINPKDNPKYLESHLTKPYRDQFDLTSRTAKVQPTERLSDWQAWF